MYVLHLLHKRAAGTTQRFTSRILPDPEDVFVFRGIMLCFAAYPPGLSFAPPDYPAMNVFINDIPLIIKKNSEKIYKHKYDLILGPEDEFISKDLVGDVLVRDVTDVFIDRLLRLMEVKKLKKLKSLTLLARKKKRLILHLKDQFKIVKAAGGLVVKDGMVLMIYRLGKWDLPKGKLKKEEDPGIGALREVEEECNIKVELAEELPSTWHSYAYNGNKILKKTNWYIMRCLDDSLMKPQAEEYIEEVRWMTPQQALAVLHDSYASIELVVRHYLSDVAGETPANKEPAK
jgi:8-oxo-dGTP pyrophosphatase MutT (NUDIX family)